MKRQSGAWPGVQPLPATRFDESDSNAAKRPSPEIASGPKLSPFAWTPPGPTSTREVVPVRRLRTKTSRMPLVSPGTRFEADEANAIRFAFADIAIPSSSTAVFPSTPPLETSARLVCAGAPEALATIGPMVARSTATHPAARPTRIRRLLAASENTNRPAPDC